MPSKSTKRRPQNFQSFVPRTPKDPSLMPPQEVARALRRIGAGVISLSDTEGLDLGEGSALGFLQCLEIFGSPTLAEKERNIRADSPLDR